jgi:hypothetical protein
MVTAGIEDSGISGGRSVYISIRRRNFTNIFELGETSRSHGGEYEDG